DPTIGGRRFVDGEPRMSEWKYIVGPNRAKDLMDAEFVEHVRLAFPDDRVIPDDQDYDFLVDVSTDDEADEQIRFAQARKLMRMYRQWKAGQTDCRCLSPVQSLPVTESGRHMF